MEHKTKKTKKGSINTIIFSRHDSFVLFCVAAGIPVYKTVILSGSFMRELCVHFNVIFCNVSYLYRVSQKKQSRK